MHHCPFMSLMLELLSSTTAATVIHDSATQALCSQSMGTSLSTPTKQKNYAHVLHHMLPVALNERVQEQI